MKDSAKSDLCDKYHSPACSNAFLNIMGLMRLLAIIAANTTGLYG